MRVRVCKGNGSGPGLLNHPDVAVLLALASAASLPHSGSVVLTSCPRINGRIERPNGRIERLGSPRHDPTEAVEKEGADLLLLLTVTQG